MGWFQKICRNAGLMVHGITHPGGNDTLQSGSKQVTKHVVEEKKIDKNITLRRTTIEEIEMKPGADRSKVNRYRDQHKP